MTANRKSQAFEAESQVEIPDVEALLAYVARRGAARGFPVIAGTSYFYEVQAGWESRVLREDSRILKVYTTFELEDAFASRSGDTILVPIGAAITKTVAQRVCRRHGEGKTVFYEVFDNGQG